MPTPWAINTFAPDQSYQLVVGVNVRCFAAPGVLMGRVGELSIWLRRMPAHRAHVGQCLTPVHTSIVPGTGPYSVIDLSATVLCIRSSNSVRTAGVDMPRRSAVTAYKTRKALGAIEIPSNAGTVPFVLTLTYRLGGYTASLSSAKRRSEHHEWRGFAVQRQGLRRSRCSHEHARTLAQAAT